MIDRQGGFFPTLGGPGDTLAILLHAYQQTPASLNRVADAVRAAYPRADILAPRLPTRTLSIANPEVIAERLIEEIGKLVEDRRAAEGAPDNGYARIILVGHSAGAVLARKIAALAHGATPQGEIAEARSKPWAVLVKRVVLLAATSRGWTVSSAQDPIMRLLWTLGMVAGNVCRTVTFGWKDLFILAFRRGAPFLSTTRLQSLALSRAAGNKGPITVQLLGSYDDLVAPTDNIDIATGSKFFYREVSRATHSNIVELDHGSGGKKAWDAMLWALKAERLELTDCSLPFELVFDLYDDGPDDFDSATVPKAAASVRNVVFVIHGIRDRGFWTRRIALSAKSMAPPARPCRTVTSTYGYFPMGPFLLPWERRAKVEWLLDQYVTAKALYPEADNFAYIGHSNGTYLLAKALELCPAVRFNSVIFAGSVVRRRYDWRKRLPGGTGQVGRMVNYVATGDWVVGLFPKGLAWLSLLFDVGGAGHDGFKQATERSPHHPGALSPLLNLKYAQGTHSAALHETFWTDMARFALGGPEPEVSNLVKIQNPILSFFAAISGLVWSFILAIVLALGNLILAPLGLPVPTPMLSLMAWFGVSSVPQSPSDGTFFAVWNWAPCTPGWHFALLFLAYVYLIRLVLQKA